MNLSTNPVVTNNPALVLRSNAEMFRDVWAHITTSTDPVAVRISDAHEITAQRINGWFVLSGITGHHFLHAHATGPVRFAAHFEGFVEASRAKLRALRHLP